jgi:hypothetical protein
MESMIEENTGSQEGTTESASATPANGTDAPSAESAPSQPQEPQFNATEWNLNYKGRPISIRDRNHLQSLATKGYGYDQEVDRIKQREATIAEQEAKYQKYMQLEQSLSSNPQLARKIFELTQNPQALQEEGSDEPEYVMQLKNQVEELSQWKQQFEHKQSDAELDKELEQLKSAFPQHDWEHDDGNGNLAKKILTHAYNEGKVYPSLQAAYRDYFWDNREATVKADTLRAEQERAQKNRLAGKVGAGNAPAPVISKPSYSPDKSYNDLAQMAESRIS